MKKNIIIAVVFVSILLTGIASSIGVSLIVVNSKTVVLLTPCNILKENGTITPQVYSFNEIYEKYIIRITNMYWYNVLITVVDDNILDTLYNFDFRFTKLTHEGRISEIIVTVIEEEFPPYELYYTYRLQIEVDGINYDTLSPVSAIAVGYFLIWIASFFLIKNISRKEKN